MSDGCAAQGERYDVWYCNHKYDSDGICDFLKLRETGIKDVFENMGQEYSDPNPVCTDERWSALVQSVTVYRGNHFIFTLANSERVISHSTLQSTPQGSPRVFLVQRLADERS